MRYKKGFVRKLVRRMFELDLISKQIYTVGGVLIMLAWIRLVTI